VTTELIEEGLRLAGKPALVLDPEGVKWPPMTWAEFEEEQCRENSRRAGFS
jgi:hypothetical protein